MTEIKACPFCGASEPCYKHEPVEVRGHADDLKARLQAGETGRDVDLEFHRWLTGENWEHHHAYMGYWSKSDKQRQQNPPKAIRYTTSIDAAYGAVPEGWKLMIFTLDSGLVTVDLDAKSGGSFGCGEADNSIPAAILLAVIDARENQ